MHVLHNGSFDLGFEKKNESYEVDRNIKTGADGKYLETYEEQRLFFTKRFAKGFVFLGSKAWNNRKICASNHMFLREIWDTFTELVF